MKIISSEHEIQEAYFSGKVAAEYVERRFTTPLMDNLHARQVAAVNRVMEEARPARTLEVAPGPGRLTRAVKPKGELVCLEYNEGMINEGRAASPATVKWMQGNAFELPFGSEFDFLYTFRFVRHFHRADRERLYEQFRQVLRPGGWLVLDAVNAAVSAPLRAARPADYPIYDKLYQNEKELSTELTAAGFTPLRLESVQRWFGLQQRVQVLIGPRSPWLCRRLIRGLEAMGSGPGLEWIVTCRRA